MSLENIVITLIGIFAVMFILGFILLWVASMYKTKVSEDPSKNEKIEKTSKLIHNIGLGFIFVPVGVMFIGLMIVMARNAN